MFVAFLICFLGLSNIPSPLSSQTYNIGDVWYLEMRWNIFFLNLMLNIQDIEYLLDSESVPIILFQKGNSYPLICIIMPLSLHARIETNSVSYRN